MLKEGEEAFKKYSELKEEFTKLKRKANPLPSSPEKQFIIKTSSMKSSIKGKLEKN